MAEAESSRIVDVTAMPVYQLFYQLALDVEKNSRSFGQDFRWLRNQILRSSESVCANMTEGFYAQYSTEYVQSLHRSRREARETMTHLSYARDVQQLAPTVFDDLDGRYREALRQLNLVIGSIERKIELRGKSKPGAMLREDEAEYVTAPVSSAAIHPQP
jgi:four helix bundle protein